MPGTVCNQFIDHPSQATHAQSGIYPLPDRLYVITVIFNPLRWLARYKHYQAFEKRVRDAGAILYTVELAFGQREYEVTEAGNPQHLQLRTDQELWFKENLINIGIQRLPADWRYVAWIDADVLFARPDWAQETLHQLQHYRVVQMFSHAQDLGPNHEPLAVTTPGFIYQYLQKEPGAEPNLSGFPGSYYYGGARGAGVGGLPYAHPGFAWAARREAIEGVGGLIDWAILGSGDWHMSCALLGKVERSLSQGFSKRYGDLCSGWQQRSEEHIRRNVGYVSGLVNHFWHGKKADRRYNTRWKLFADAGFDPDKDLQRDWQGLWRLTGRNTRLRDGLMEYARARNEDSIDR